MLAIIGGSGFAQVDGFVESETLEIATPYGPASIQKGRLKEAPVLFLSRHGNPPRFPPHRINYRANIWALADLLNESRDKNQPGKIIAVNAVGSISSDLQLGQLVFTDQIIDYTCGREHTFYEDEIHHVDFTFPYDAELRRGLVEAAVQVRKEVVFQYSEEGVYGCVQGPRLETAAEIRRMANDGCDVVGMTAMPEAALAREKKIAYAGISVVINQGAGIGNQTVDLGAVEDIMRKGMGFANRVVSCFAGAIDPP